MNIHLTLTNASQLLKGWYMRSRESAKYGNLLSGHNFVSVWADKAKYWFYGPITMTEISETNIEIRV